MVYYQTPFLYDFGKRKGSCEWLKWALLCHSNLLSLCEHPIVTLRIDLNVSLLNMSSSSFQNSSEGFSSLPNQYKSTISVRCSEVTDSNCCKAWLNQTLDTLKSNFERALWDDRETGNGVSACRCKVEYYIAVYLWVCSRNPQLKSWYENTILLDFWRNYPAKIGHPE